MVYQGSAVSLGVGASTIVITSFLVALTDGKIDPSERRMLGVLYVALRVAMFSILGTTALIAALKPAQFDGIETYLIILIAALFANAILMTKHWISSKIGPAIQAGTWYTLGFVMTIYAFSLFSFTPLGFATLYGTDILIAIVIVNAFMLRMKHKAKEK